MKKAKRDFMQIHTPQLSGNQQQSSFLARELSSCGHKGQGGERVRNSSQHLVNSPPPTTRGGSSFSSPFH